MLLLHAGVFIHVLGQKSVELTPTGECNRAVWPLPFNGLKCTWYRTPVLLSDWLEHFQRAGQFTTVYVCFSECFWTVGGVYR